MAMFKDKREESTPAAASAEVPDRRPRPEPQSRLRPKVRLNLARGADGRIRPADQTDIGDLWAEQQRIRLRQEIAEDKRKAEKQRKRAQNGRFGFKKAKRTLPKVTAITPAPSPQPGMKEVVIAVSLPKLRPPKLPRLPFALSHKRLLVGGGTIVAAIALLMLSFTLYPEPSNKMTDRQRGTKGVTSESINGEALPAYDTLLPQGKSIEELGGWARVSPPDKEPVFAYRDTVGGVPVLISQQPLPAPFKKDVVGEIEKLAAQFTANEKVSVQGLTVYIGTSIKGPQSVIFSKSELLFLIKSDAKIDNQAWADYIGSLN